MLKRKFTALLVLIMMLQLVWIPQASTSTEPQTLPLASTTYIYVNGTVTNSTGGLPVGGANVTFFNATTGAYVNSTLTNETGFYNITLENGTYNISARAADHYKNSSLTDYSISTNTTLNILLCEIPGRIEGAVYDSSPNQHPLSGVSVNITFLLNGTEKNLTNITNADGNFTLENITAGAQAIEISASGYPSEHRTITVRWNSTSRVDIYLAGATMKGTIKDDSGNPLSAAVSVENGSAWFNTTSGYDGRYSISGLREGDYNITVEKTGYLLYENQSIHIGTGETVWENGTLTGGGIAGNVTDNAGRLIPGATITLTESGTEVASASSGQNGSFRISSIPTGDYVLTVSKSGYTQNSTNLHITAGHTTYIDPVLIGGTVSGMVVDDAGRAVADATIELIGTDYNTKSNRSGGYSIEGIAEGDYYLKASHEGYITSISDAEVHISPAEPVLCNFTLRGGTLMGIVNNGTSPLADVNVTLILSSGVGLSAKTGENGRYTIKGIPTGVYALTASLAGYHNSTIGGITITAGETTTQDLSMEKLRGTISGSVKSSTGPIEGVRVWVSIPGGIKFSYTGDDGNYSITDLPAGIYNVTAEKDGYYSSYVAGVVVMSGKTTANINFTLEGKLSVLKGIVSNGTYPIVGVNIEILELKYNTYTDPYGAYRIENIPPGTYTVVATKQGYRPNATYGVLIQRGATAELNFTLEEIPGIVWGYVTDKKGEPIVQATVEISSGSYSTTTDINGYYKLAGIDPGIYTLTAYKTGYKTTIISGVNITTEYENHVNITLNPAGGENSDNQFTIIPGIDMVHSFMVIGLMIVLALMLLSIIYTHRHGKDFSKTRFMDMLKQQLAEDAVELKEGTGDRAVENKEKDEKKRPKKKKLKKR